MPVEGFKSGDAFNKVFAGDDCDLKAIKAEDGWYIEGYANTKHKADRYMDIPMDGCYQLKEFKKNPLMLIDHDNSAAAAAGKFVVCEEDEKGLFVRAKLMENPVNPLVQHAINAVKEKIIKAFSIRGRWHYERKEGDPHWYIKKADIWEISLVGIPADPRSLITKVGEESGKTIEPEDGKGEPKSIEELIKAYREQPDEKILIDIMKKRDNNGSQKVN